MSNKYSHIAFFAANVNTMYSASVDNRATMNCLLEYQLTELSFSIKMKSKVDF